MSSRARHSAHYSDDSSADVTGGIPRGDGESMAASGDFLDGNAAAGPFSEIFRFDVTCAQGQCDSCDHVGVFAATKLFSHGPGLVVRCSQCDAVLMKYVESEGRVWLDLRGLRYLQIERT